MDLDDHAGGSTPQDFFQLERPELAKALALGEPKTDCFLCATITVLNGTWTSSPDKRGDKAGDPDLGMAPKSELSVSEASWNDPGREELRDGTEDA